MGREEINEMLHPTLERRLKPVLDKVPAVILYNGKQVKLPSGKSAWRDKGAARIALTQALSFHYTDDAELIEVFKRPANLRQYLEDQGIIEIKTFEE